MGHHHSALTLYGTQILSAMVLYPWATVHPTLSSKVLFLSVLSCSVVSDPWRLPGP